MSEDCGTPIEMDVMAICYDFCEYNPEQLFMAYAPISARVRAGGESITAKNVRELWDEASDADREAMIKELVDELIGRTTIIKVEGLDSYIVETF
jgi:hypothetical protein